MPQKPLKASKAGKIQKKQAANRHGKTPQMKKGKFDIPPKQKRLQEQYHENKDLTKVINEGNEALAAAKAAAAGGRLNVVKGKAPPPVLASADAKQKAKSAKKAAKAAEES